MTDPDLDNRQRILQFLLERPRSQKELADALGISPAGLKYHVDRLADENLVQKRTVSQFGSVSVYEVSLVRAALQHVRALLGQERPNYTLLTGYGIWETAYRLPDIGRGLLVEAGFSVTRVVAFTTPEAKEKRDAKRQDEMLLDLDAEISHAYQEYRDWGSSFFQQVEESLVTELEAASVVIDLTPLSKLYTLALLKLSKRYRIPSYYLGKTEDDQDQLLWLEHFTLDGESWLD